MAIDSVQKVNYLNVLASYKMVEDGIIKSVPLDPTNTDYQAVLKWVADGNTIEEAD
tara:strand:+ start:591 stop:758 length:168 start_codon:yes stop_codon:yes gene_type:complete